MTGLLAFLSGLPGGGEIILLFIAVLVLFGAKRLPEIARSIGKTLEQLRSASDDFKSQIMSMDSDPVDTPGETADHDVVDIDPPTSHDVEDYGAAGEEEKDDDGKDNEEDRKDDGKRGN